MDLQNIAATNTVLSAVAGNQQIESLQFLIVTISKDSFLFAIHLS
jgi:hypothetical protein